MEHKTSSDALRKPRRESELSLSQLARRVKRHPIDKLKRLFWDKPLILEDFIEYPTWVVGRVLEYGALDDIHMLITLIGRREFLNIVSECRFVSAKTAHFWGQMLKKEKMSCTKKYSRGEVKNCWPG